MAVRNLKAIKSDTLFRTVSANAQRIGGKYFASIPVELLCIDEAYQRTDTRSKKSIELLAKKWNDHKMSPLLVTAHKDENKFCVVDGWGRMVASSMLEVPKTELECEIIFDVPEDVEERRKFEAELFVNQFTEQETLKAYQKHKARMLLGDEIAIAIQEMCDKYDVKIGFRSGHRKIRTLGSYSETYTMTRVCKKEGLEFIFDTIEKLHWDEEQNGYSRCVLNGLRKVYERSKEDAGAQSKIITVLRGTTPENIKARAIATYAERKDQTAVAMMFEDILNGN